MTAVPDIPRLYAALAECLATLLYAQQLMPRYSARRSTALPSIDPVRVPIVSPSSGE